MKLQKVFLLVTLYSSITLLAQNIRDYDIEMQQQHAEAKGYDPAYRVNCFENIILKTNYTIDEAQLELVNVDEGQNISIKPLATHQIGFSFDYKWIGLGVSFAPKGIGGNSDDSAGTDGSYISAELNFFYSDQWRQELRYRSYDGFLNPNNSFFDDDNPFPLDLTTVEVIEGSTFYIANKNFSFRAHYAQTERQLKSAGSFIPRLKYSFMKSKPNVDSEINQTYANIEQINSIDILAQIGYLYTFVWEQKWFTTIGIRPGVGFNNSKYNFVEGITVKDSNSTFSYGLGADLKVGYNNYRWFFGAGYELDSYYYQTIIDEQVRRETGNFSVYLGYRFNDNKPMRKFFGWFEDTFGF